MLCFCSIVFFGMYFLFFVVFCVSVFLRCPFGILLFCFCCFLGIVLICYAFSNNCFAFCIIILGFHV